MLNPGDRFGDYTVVRLLGKGGMGAVYLLKTAEGGQVAAKILDPAMAGDHESRKRFLREAELALGVKHPNLVETYDVGEDPDTGLCYILMEYVPGGSLADRLDEGPLPINDAIRIVYQIASVLELAREKGIVHRDIKPANIMFGADGKAKLADLGIARGGVGGANVTTVTQTGMMIGTPAYMAPEQMLDAHHVDSRADIYSLGIVFYEMLAGERPHPNDTVVQLMAKAVAGEPIPDVRTMRPEVSAAVAELISLMCAMKADERVATPREVTTALSQIAHGREVTIRRKAPKAVSKSDRTRGWRNALVACGLLSAAVAVAVGAWCLVGENAEPQAPMPVSPPTPPPTPQPARVTVVTNTVIKVLEEAVEKTGAAVSGDARRTETDLATSPPEVRQDMDAESTKPVLEAVDRAACEILVEHVLVKSTDGVRRDCVENTAEAVRSLMPKFRNFYGDPYAANIRHPPFVMNLTYRNSLLHSGSYRPSREQWNVFVGEDGNWSPSMSTLEYMLGASLCVAPEQNWASLVFFANHLLADETSRIAQTVKAGRAVDPQMSLYDWLGRPQRKDVPQLNRGPNYYPIHQWRSFGPLEALRQDRPSVLKDYFALKLRKAKEGKLSWESLSVPDEVALFSEVMGRDVTPVFNNFGWPLDAVQMRPETDGTLDPSRFADEDPPRRVQKAVDALFPGWKVKGIRSKSGDAAKWDSAFVPVWRGRKNIVSTMPPNGETEVVLSRTVQLPKRHPVLVLELASCAKDTDFLLKVKAGGRLAFGPRLICTPDERPYERIVVPLERWRGRQTKIEVVHECNGWYLEHAFWSKLEIAEGDGKERPGPVGVVRKGVFPAAMPKSMRWKKRGVWKYVTTEPSGDWKNLDFDDGKWKRTIKALGYDKGPLPMSVADLWRSDRIWIRRKFNWTGPMTVYKVDFDLFFDQDVEIYLNGQEVLRRGGWNGDWVPTAGDAKAFASALRSGENVLAVTLKGDGASYFDCGLAVEAIPGEKKSALDGSSARLAHAENLLAVRQPEVMPPGLSDAEVIARAAMPPQPGDFTWLEHPHDQSPGTLKVDLFCWQQQIDNGDARWAEDRFEQLGFPVRKRMMANHDLKTWDGSDADLAFLWSRASRDAYSDDEVKAIERYLRDGGNVVVVSHNPEGAQARLLEHFGLRVRRLHAVLESVAVCPGLRGMPIRTIATGRGQPVSVADEANWRSMAVRRDRNSNLPVMAMRRIGRGRLFFVATGLVGRSDTDREWWKVFLNACRRDGGNGRGN